MKAKGQKKKKKTTKKNKQTKSLLNTILLCILVLGISYLIFETNILEPKIDGVTASYISFDNLNSTDMMKIKDLSKLSDEVGKSNLNTSKAEFDVAGKEIGMMKTNLGGKLAISVELAGMGETEVKVVKA